MARWSRGPTRSAAGGEGGVEGGGGRVEGRSPDELQGLGCTQESVHPAKGPDNTSRWNTGREQTLPVSRSAIWYSFQDNNPATLPGTPCAATYTQEPPATRCPQLFPELGIGGVGPHGAAPYDFDADNPNPTNFPEYWDGSFVLGEFTRGLPAGGTAGQPGQRIQGQQHLPCGGVGSGQKFTCDNRWTSSSTTTAPSTC